MSRGEWHEQRRQRQCHKIRNERRRAWKGSYFESSVFMRFSAVERCREQRRCDQTKCDVLNEHKIGEKVKMRVNHEDVRRRQVIKIHNTYVINSFKSEHIAVMNVSQSRRTNAKDDNRNRHKPNGEKDKRLKREILSSCVCVCVSACVSSSIASKRIN